VNVNSAAGDRLPPMQHNATSIAGLQQLFHAPSCQGPPRIAGSLAPALSGAHPPRQHHARLVRTAPHPSIQPGRIGTLPETEASSRSPNTAPRGRRARPASSASRSPHSSLVAQPLDWRLTKKTTRMPTTMASGIESHEGSADSRRDFGDVQRREHRGRADGHSAGEIAPGEGGETVRQR